MIIYLKIFQAFQEDNKMEAIPVDGKDVGKGMEFSSDKNKPPFVEDIAREKIDEINEGSDSNGDCSSNPLNTEKIRNQKQTFSGLFKASAMPV